ncbi:hypothetical protein [Brevundimonas sp. FT23042]|uniref:hypothetical protein n=1 Tax=Brevundimonas sp. FT23042 TaxID=3393749 RepID=UPI003B586CBB
MSADEFDPEIERLFARTPPMADAALFTAEVEAKLQRGSRLRYGVLGVAGLVGGLVAVREVLTVRFSADAGEPAVLVGRGLEAATVNAQTALGDGLERLGLGSVDLASTGGMQMFWVVAAALIAVASAGLMRLSQEV